MKKRGQLEQPFIYIFALVVIAFIIFFGFSAIRKVTKLGESVSTVTFKSELEKQVNHFYYMDTGSRGEVSLDVPLNFKYVCFADKSGVLDKFPQQDSILRNLVKTTDRNIYLLPAEGNKIESYTIANVRGSENPFCVLNSKGLIVFILENKGDYVEARK